MKIVLIGFMATGKSTVAPLVATKLGLDVIEMDDLIIRKSGLPSITDIFETGGEAAFRRLETAVAEDLQDCDNAVVSTGGGVVMDPSVMKGLAANAIVVELTAPFDTLLQRISPAMPRPLFADAAAAKALYERRKPLYNKYAAIHVSTDDRQAESVVQEIIDKVPKS